jgi:hypothetical protein
MVSINVALSNDAVRDFLVDFEADDDVFARTLHPDEFTWHPIDENRVALHGIDAAIRNRNAWLDTWDEHRVDVDEVIEDGDDVVASIHITARGKGSGASADVRFYIQVKTRDGKVTYIYDHEERAAALEAAGLRE